MTRITDISELRSIQIGILNEVVRVCKKHNIKYVLAAGSLLGAVRHKGYIPWDDDIDLYMLRSEYNRFLAVFNNECENKYTLYSPEITKNFYYCFGKVIDTRTLMIEKLLPKNEIGVYLDIFPIDYVPENMRKRTHFYKINHLLRKIRRCKVTKTCTLKTKISYYFYRCIPIPLFVINKLIDKYISSHKPTSMVCDMQADYLPPTAAFSVSDMTETVPMEFEGVFYEGMRGYDDYLTILYGNYMEIPPVEKRRTHQFEAYWR